MLRRVFRAIVLASCLVGPMVAVAQSPPQLTLAAAVDEALRKNGRVLDQGDTMSQADLGLRLARNSFKPKVTPNIFGSFGRTDVSSQVYRVDVTQKLTNGAELRLWTGTASAQIPGVLESSPDVLFYNADTTLTLSQPLLRGRGRAVARRSLAAAELRKEDAARHQLLAEQQVAMEVASAYYRVVAQQSFAEVAQLALASARRLRDASEAKLNAGLVSQLDVLRAQQLVAQSEMQLFDAQSAVDDARDQLTFLMGRRSTEPFALDTEIPRVGGEPIDVASATRLALASRVDLKSRLAARDDAENQMRFARNQLLPQVDVNLAVTRRETAPSFKDSFALSGYKSATFFTIAMPVDRAAQQIEYQSVLIERERLRRDTETLERKIGDDVKQVVRERERLLRGVVAAETSVALSRREVEVAQLRYGNGLSNNLDVVSAEAGLLQAESRRIQALADSIIVNLRLRAVLGVFNPRTDMSGAPAVFSVTPHWAQ